MTPDPYVRMELLRLSPDNGKTLTRLNLMPGQTLHGRVFKMTPYGGTTGTDNGGIAKIALGSHLIEAVVSKSLPEGAHVTLEVVKLGDESFILRLISVEGSLPGGARSAGAQIEPDQIDLSPQALEKLNGTLQKPLAGQEQTSTSRLIETLDWSALPKPLAQSLRAAVSTGFIEPAGLTANVAAMRVVLHQAIEGLHTAIASTSPSAPAEAGELFQAINSIIAMLRPMTASLPSAEISIEDSVAQMATALRNTAAALRPTLSQATPTRAGGDVAMQPGVQPESQASRASATPGSQSQPAPGTSSQQSQQTSATDAGPAARAVPPNMSLPAATPGKPIVPPPATVLPQGPSPADTTGAQLPSAQLTQTGAVSPDAAQRALIGANQEIQHGTSQPARHLLFGMRALAILTSRLAQAKGWSVEQSADLANHAGRINTLTDAIEGAILAPLLARSIDVPDLIPRVLLSLLFPGWYAELGVLQPDQSGHDSHGAETDREDDSDEHTTVGVMRLKTEALGQMRIRLDYRESSDTNRVSGQFVADPLVADEIRDSLVALDRALDARGLVSDGFRVIALNPDDDDHPPPEGRAGSLDMKV